MPNAGPDKGPVKQAPSRPSSSANMLSTYLYHVGKALKCNQIPETHLRILLCGGLNIPHKEHFSRMKQLASPLCGQDRLQCEAKPAKGCHSRENGNPKNLFKLPLAQEEHRSRHKGAWIPACAGMTQRLLHSAKMLPLQILLINLRDWQK